MQVLIPMISILIIDRKEDTEKGRSHLRTEAETGVKQPQHWKKQGKVLHSNFQIECGPADTLISDFWPPEPGENKFLF